MVTDACLKLKIDTYTMSSKSSRDVKSTKIAATCYLISGFIFVIVAAVSGKVGIYLPLGVALFIISICFWQHSKRLADNEHKGSSY